MPFWFPWAPQVHAQAYLVPAGGIDLEGLPLAVDLETFAVRGLGVLEDELLVQLLHGGTHCWPPRPKKGRTVARAAPKAATSSSVVYTDAEARALEGTPSRRCSGWAQW